MTVGPNGWKITAGIGIVVRAPRGYFDIPSVSNQSIANRHTSTQSDGCIFRTCIVQKQCRTAREANIMNNDGCKNTLITEMGIRGMASVENMNGFGLQSHLFPPLHQSSSEAPGTNLHPLSHPSTHGVGFIPSRYVSCSDECIRP